jgi:hypothetical protein
MAFNGNFTATVTPDISAILLTDTSTGADANLTGRTVSIYKTDGSLLGGAVINWPIAASTLTIPGILPKDYSLSIVVNWISSAPLASPSTYTKTVLSTFTGNSYYFAMGLVQQIAAKQGITNDSQFLANMNIFYTYLDNANLAQTYGNQGNAQENLDFAYGMIVNQNLFF